MKKILIISLLSLISIVYATGPSYASITLKPLATNSHGEVLFGVSRDINPTGANSIKYEKFGWLVVSSSGVWDEKVAFIGKDNNLKNLSQIEKYNKGKINLKNPDKVLKALMKKYGFTKQTPLINEKYKILELKSKQSCYMGKCINKVLQQKTIENYHCNKIEVPVRSSFSYKGVILVHNINHFEEKLNKGCIFNIKNFTLYPDRDIGYDIMEVDGIVLLKGDIWE